MKFIFRGLMILVGAAFLFAVANLAISGMPQTQVAALDAEGTPAQQPVTDAPQIAAPGAEPPSFGTIMAQMLNVVFGPDRTGTGTATPITAPIGQLAGLATPTTSAPASAGGDNPLASRELQNPGYDAVAATWRGWMQINGIQAGALAVVLPDGTEYGTGIGNRTADDIRPVMSMSKTITGLCVDQLLLEAGLGWDTTLGDIAPQMSAAGLTPRPWNEHITLGSLATHTSGLAPDLTQSNMVGDTHGALGLHRRWAAAALQEDAITGSPGSYFYSNTNYTVLGVVVEALSGQSYAQACMDRVLTPAGITDAVIEGRYGSLSSYAGWELSAMDYARLARHWFDLGQPHMTTPRPDHDGYAIGYHDDGETISHTGRFCQRDHPTGGLGSLFIHTRDGTTISVNWDACIQEGHSSELIHQLLEHL